MKKTQTTTISIILMICALLLVTACSNTQTEESQPNLQDNNGDTDGNPDSINSIKDADASVKTDIATQQVDATITIEGGKFTPKEIVVPSGEINIHIINKEPTQQRIQFLFSEARAAIDVPANDEGYLTVNPKYAGRVLVELNGAKMGGITVEK